MFTAAPPLYSKPAITEAFQSQDANQNQWCLAPYLNRSEDPSSIRNKNDYIDSFSGQNLEKGFADQSDNPRYYSALDTNTTSIKRPLVDQDDRVAMPTKKAWDGGSLQQTDDNNFTYQCIDYGHRKLGSSMYDDGTTDRSSFQKFKSASKEKDIPDNPTLSDQEFFRLFEVGLDSMIRTDYSVRAILDTDTRLDRLLSPLFRSQDFDSVTEMLGNGEEAVAAKKLQKLVCLTKKKIQFLCSKIMKSFSDRQKEAVEKKEPIKKPEKRISLRKKKTKEHAKLCRSIIRSYRDEHDRQKLKSQDLRRSPDVSPQIPHSQPQLSLTNRPTTPYPLLLPDVSKTPHQPNLLPDVSQPQYPPSLLPDVSRPQYPPSLLPDVSKPSYPPSLLPGVSRPSYPPSLLPDVSRPPYPPSLMQNVSRPSYPPSLLPDVSRPPYPPSLMTNVCQTQYSLSLGPIPQAGMFPGSFVSFPTPLMPRSNSDPVHQQPQVSQAATYKKKQKPRNLTSCLRQIELVSLKRKTKNIPVLNNNLVMVKDNKETSVVLGKNKKNNSVSSPMTNEVNEGVVIKRYKKKVRKKIKKDISQMTPREKLIFLTMNVKSFKTPSNKTRFLEKLFEHIGRSFLNVEYRVTHESGCLFGALYVDRQFVTRRKAENKQRLKKIVYERAYNVLRGFPAELIISLGDPNSKEKKNLKEERFDAIIDIRQIKNSSAQILGKSPARAWLHKVCTSVKRPLLLKCVDEKIIGPDSVQHSMAKIMLNHCTLAVANAPSFDLASEKAYTIAVRRVRQLSAKEIAYEKGLQKSLAENALKESLMSKKRENVPLSIKEKFEKIKLLLKKYPQNQTKTMKERYLNSVADSLKMPHSLVYRRIICGNPKIICNLYLGETFVAATKNGSITKARAAVYILAWRVLSYESLPFSEPKAITREMKNRFFEWKETGRNKKSKTVSVDKINRFIKENKKEQNKKTESARVDVIDPLSIKDPEIISEDVLNQFSIKDEIGQEMVNEDETEKDEEPEIISEDVINKFCNKDEIDQDEGQEIISEDVISPFCNKDENPEKDEGKEIISKDVLNQFPIFKVKTERDGDTEIVSKDVLNQFCNKDEGPEIIIEDVLNWISIKDEIEQEKEPQIVGDIINQFSNENAMEQDKEPQIVNDDVINLFCNKN